MTIITKIANKPEIVQTTSIPGIPMIMMTKRSVFGLDVEKSLQKNALISSWGREFSRITGQRREKDLILIVAISNGEIREYKKDQFFPDNV